MSLDAYRLIRLTLFGALAGFFIFCIFNPGLVREEQADINPIMGGDMAQEIMDGLVSAFLGTLVLATAFSVMLGGMLVLAEEYNSPPKRIAIRMGMVCGAGAVVGAIAGLIAQFLFMILLLVTLGLGLIAARAVAWAAMGSGAAVCVGYVLGGWRRSMMGLLGGFCGGLAGGILFDIIGIITQGGSASRFVGFILIGAVTGAAVAFVEDMAKQSWVTVLSGPKEGRSFILTKQITTIGRSEYADIPLFGDQGVAPNHVRLVLQGPSVTLEAAPGTTVTVNGVQTPSAVLRPWDVFSIGRYSIRFHQKVAVSQHALVQLPDLTVPRPQPSYSSVNRTMMQAAAPRATGQLVLTCVAGPHLNQRFQFGPGTVTIGRENSCQVILAQDTVVSRNHAEISWDGTKWTVKDMNSRNGLWINGVKASTHVLNVGDQIGVGQTWLRADCV